MTAETFGQLLRRHRLSVGLSQVQLARHSGIDPAYVNRLERGTTLNASGLLTIPSRAVVIGLARALDLGDSQTDRLLFAAGLAPQEDWQPRAVRAETALAAVRQALDDATAAEAEPTFIRRAV